MLKDRVSLKRYSYQGVPTAAFRESAFRLGGALVFGANCVFTTRARGGGPGCRQQWRGGGQGGRFSRYGLLGFSWASLGSSCRFLGLSWLILGLLGPLLAHLGGLLAPKGCQKKPKGANKKPKRGQDSPKRASERDPKSPKTCKKNR